MTKTVAKEKMIPYPVSMPPSMIADLKKEAEREKEETGKDFVSVSIIIRRAVALYLEMRMHKTLADWINAQPEPKE